jgi:nuclear transport factor 2 (NTF2) superfamily protein
MQLRRIAWSTPVLLGNAPTSVAVCSMWAYHGNRIAVRFAYEYRDDSGSWFRAYGNENWEFASDGLMRQRFASINELPISDAQRLFRWPQGPRPQDHAGLSALDL